MRYLLRIIKIPIHGKMKYLNLKINHQNSL